jgi:acetyl-CoA C-acetyltransferase
MGAQRHSSRVAILGSAATPVGRLAPRYGQMADGLEHDILAEVAADALLDAGISPDRVDAAIFTQNPPTTRQLGFATFMMAQLGLQCRGLVTEVSQLGLTGGVAFDQAAAQIQLGQAEYSLALGVVRQSLGDMSMAMDFGIRAVGDVNFQAPFAIPPIGWYALDCARYIHEHGASREDIAHVTVKSREYARHNPLAQFRQPLSIREVMEQRPIVDPLGLFEVPARADGAICLVLCSEETAVASGQPYVIVSGRGFYHEGHHQISDHPHSITEFASARLAVKTSLVQAGVTLADIDLAELYAPCTITEILVTESIGMFDRGEGYRALLQGDTSIGGRSPVNTSGGCLARGHPPQLTGLYGLLELREQLLGQAGERQVPGARLGLHTCELGNYNATLAHVLEAPQ